MKPVSVLLSVALLCLTACTPKFNSDADKWVFFANDKSDKLYYTLDKLDKTDKGVIKIWVKTIFGKKINIDNKDAIYAKNMYMINCTANSYKMNVGFYFSATDEMISRTASAQPDVMPLILDRSSREFTFKPISTAKEEYFPILPNSPVAALQTIACKQKI
jgi:hypothetical protein